MKAISVRGKGGIGGGGMRNSGGPSGVSRIDDIPEDDAEHRDHQNDFRTKKILENKIKECEQNCDIA
jgi:hypothetical protein